MTNLEYQDKHKFVASFGITLIGFSVLLPWLFLKEPFDLLLESSKLKSLTLAAQSAINYRQSLVQFLMVLIPYVCVVFFLLGLVILFVGLHGWNRKQAVQDRTEALNLEKLEKEARKTTGEALVEKWKEQTEELGEAKTTATHTTDAARGAGPQSTAIAKYQDVESRIIERIREADPKIFELLSQRTVAGRNFDAILARKTANGPDILIEIKYLIRKPTKSEFYRILDRQISTTRTYEIATGRSARGVAIVVVPSHEFAKDVARTWFEPRLEWERKKEKNQFISIISEGEIKETDFGEIVAGDIQYTKDSEAWDGMHSNHKKI